jgi:hypothetical protein
VQTQHQSDKKTRSRRYKPLLEVQTQHQPDKKTRSRRSKPVDTKKSPDKKKPLNLYQTFVKKESQKSIYKGVPATERMMAISKEWNIQKTK